MSDQDMTSDETLKLLWDQVETRPPQAESKLRNCGLKRLLNRLKYAIAEAKHYQDVAQRATDENTALQAVVDKLPKTADGVLITNHMPVWVIDRGKPRNVIWMGWACGEVCVDAETDHWEPDLRQVWGNRFVYSTREAATAAMSRAAK